MMVSEDKQKRDGLRRQLAISLVLVIVVLTVIALLAWNARFAVASGEMSDDLGYFKYGYKIEQYYLRNSFKLTIWSSRGMEFVYSGPMTIDEVVEQRWLKNDAAIYLNLQIRHHDSMVSEHAARIIFDFHRGEIYTSSGFTLWRNFDHRHDPKDMLSDDEFDAVLARLEQYGYPAIWFAPVNDPNKPDWEILPQEAKPGEVILSKRNELGLLSNFAPTPFVYHDKKYASLEGFWQMMLYPEGADDPRAKAKGIEWKYTREQVAQMTAFDAKAAGTLAEENMKKIGIGWCTFEGRRFPYRSSTPGEHYRLIVEATRAKVDQNPEVKRVLLATGDLILKPDHHGEPDPPPEWKYYEILTQIRTELQKPGP